IRPRAPYCISCSPRPGDPLVHDDFYPHRWDLCRRNRGVTVWRHVARLTEAIHQLEADGLRGAEHEFLVLSSLTGKHHVIRIQRVIEPEGVTHLMQRAVVVGQT